MAKFKYEGLDVFTDTINKLGDAFEDTARKAVYNGAGIVADAIKANIEALPESRDKAYAAENQKATGLLPSQKRDLIYSFGISKAINDNGNINVKLGFDGYNSVITKRYPYGQPNAMIARSVESGTSFRRKIPFISRAYSKTKKTAEDEMSKVFDEAISKITK